MSDLTKEQLDRVRAVAMREVDAILAEMAAEEVKKAEWPQIGDMMLMANSFGYVYEHKWHDGESAGEHIAIGNCFRPEHRPYLERQIEAQKVRAELMRQPGRSKGPVDGCEHWCFDWDGAGGRIIKNAHCLSNSMNIAIAGVWFKSEGAINAAAKVVGLDRIKLYFDWFIDTDIEGCPR